MLDESGEFLDTEMPDMVAEPPNLEREVSSPVNEDNDALVSENRRWQRMKIPMKTRSVLKNLILWLRDLELASAINFDRA